MRNYCLSQFSTSEKSSYTTSNCPRRGLALLETTLVLLVVTSVCVVGLQVYKGGVSQVFRTVSDPYADYHRKTTLANRQITFQAGLPVKKENYIVNYFRNATPEHLTLVSLLAVAFFGTCAIIVRGKRQPIPKQLAQYGPNNLTTETVDTTFQDQQSAKLIDKRQHLFRQLCSDLYTDRQKPIPVKLLMSTKLATVKPLTPVETVREKMQTEKLHHLLVCDQAGHLLGVISDRDFGNRQGTTAEEIMTPSPATIESWAPLISTVSQMTNRRISCLPVVDEGQLVGILSSTDVVLAFQCLMQMVQCRELLPDVETPNLKELAPEEVAV